MEVPTPRITARADGHWAICPICELETVVVITDRPFLDVNGDEKGMTTDYDLTAFETHYQTEHPDA